MNAGETPRLDVDEAAPAELDTVVVTITTVIRGRELDRSQIAQAASYHGQGMALAAQLPDSTREVHVDLELDDGGRNVIVRVARELAEQMPLELEGKFRLELTEAQRERPATHDLTITRVLD